jgi:PAS domain S-box-containing protein
MTTENISAGSRSTSQFKGSLSRRIVIIMVLLTLIPVLIMGIFSYIRGRSLLRDQITQQLSVITANLGEQLNSIVRSNERTLDVLVVDQNFIQTIRQLQLRPDDQIRRVNAQVELLVKQPIVAPGQVSVDQLVILTPDGVVLVSTNKDWEKVDFTQYEVFSELINQNRTATWHSPLTEYRNQIVIFTARTIETDPALPLLTIIAITTSTVTENILVAAGSYFNPSNAYLYTGKSQLFRYNPSTDQLSRLPEDPEADQSIYSLFKTAENGRSGEYLSRNGTMVLGFARWLPRLNAGLIIEVPVSAIYSQVANLLYFNGILLAVALIITAVLVFILSLQVVNPLLDLVGHARNFAKGDWSQRAVVNRSDEIGLLSNTFNSMIEQMSDLYRSLENKVDERTRQLKAASEIVQIASNANRREEMIHNIVNLVRERFNYPYVAIFSLDPSGSVFILDGISTSLQVNQTLGMRMRAETDDLVGWCITNNRHRHYLEGDIENPVNSMLIHTDTRSAIALPISIASQLVAVLFIQSDNPYAFDTETISALQALAGQIGSGMQKIRIVESTQVNLDETMQLYLATRNVTAAKDSIAALDILIKTLQTTPYVSGVIAVEQAFLRVVIIHDPRNPDPRHGIQGITLPLIKSVSILADQPYKIVDDLSKLTDFESILSFFWRRGCKNAAILGVKTEQQISHIVILASREKQPMTETQLNPFINLADILSSTLSRISHQMSLDKQVQNLETITHVAQRLSTETNINNVFLFLHEQIIKTLGNDIDFAVALLNTKTNQIEYPYVMQGMNLLSRSPEPMGDGLASYIIKTKAPLLLSDDVANQSNQMGAISGDTPKSCMGMPLIAGGEVIGALLLQDNERENRFSEDNFNLYVTLAPQIATTIKNTQLYAGMQQALADFDQEAFLLNTLLDIIPDQVYFKNNENQFIRVSQSYANYFEGASKEKMTGTNLANWIGVDDRAPVEEEENKVVESGETIEDKIESYPGSTENDLFWKQTSIFPINYSNEKNMGVLGISRDITSLKKAQAVAQQRANQLLTAQEIARDASATFDLDLLLNRAVNLVLERFNFYHASIFLLDPLGEYAVLRESTGPAGKQMKETGHKLAIGSVSIVGQATSRKQAMVINNVFEDTTYFANPLLPETRSELTIPLLIGGDVLGALDVQSKSLNAFSTDDISTLQILADQLAIAVLNARLYTRAQENLRQHRFLHRIVSQASSQMSLNEALSFTVDELGAFMPGDLISIFLTNLDGSLGIRAYAGFAGKDLSNLEIQPGVGIVGRCAQSRLPVMVEDVLVDSNYIPLVDNIRSEIAVPIMYSDRLLGVLNIESTQPASYDENDQEILNTLANSLGTILYNFELVNNIRQQVLRQQQLYDITSRIRRSVDIPSILQTTANEMAKSLGATRAKIELVQPGTGSVLEEPPRKKGKGNNGHQGAQE